MTSKTLRTTPLLALTAFSTTTMIALAAMHPAHANSAEPWRMAQAAETAPEATDLEAAPVTEEDARKKRKEQNRAERRERREENGGADNGSNGEANGLRKGRDNGGQQDQDTTTAPPETTAPQVKTINKLPAESVEEPVVLPKELPPPAAKTVTPEVTDEPTKPKLKTVTQPLPPAVRNPAAEAPVQRRLRDGAATPVQQSDPNDLPPAVRRRPIEAAPVTPPVPSTLPKASTTTPVVETPETKPAVKTLDEAKAGRIERREDGGNRIVIKEADKRTIVRQGNRVVIQKDESAQIKRVAPTAVITRDRLGRKRSVVARANNAQIVTETDRNGQLLRRYRRDRDGRETAIIDNRRRKDNFGRNLAIGVGVGAGIIAGAAILNSVVDVPPPVVRVPRNKYIVDYEDASEEDVYEALNAPPVDRIDRRYTLDQIRATPRLRERMRRVDLDDINFATGSWDVHPSQYRKLERIARAMMRVIRRNPNEVFLIEGYTDAVGSDVDNLTLSDRRAESVSIILSEQFEVPFENLTTQGYGEDYLKIDTLGPEIVNRRVAVRRITPLLNQDISAAQPDREPAYGDSREDDERGPRNRWRRYNRD